MNKSFSLILLGVLTCLVVVGAAGLWFGYEMLRSMKDDEIRLRQDMANQSELVLRRQSLKSVFERASAEKQQLDSYFFSTSEFDWLRFDDETKKIIRSSGVDAETTIGPFTKDAKFFSEDVKFSGTWEQIYRLLSLIENYPARVVIEKFTMQAEGSSRDVSPNGTWTGTLTFKLVSIRPAK